MKKPAIVLALASVSALALAGCATTTPGAETDAFTVVASTNVYAQIAHEIAGDAVEIVPIIDSAAKDPHEYELTAQDQLKVSEADLIIENGGGYDAFMDAAIEASGVEAPVITAAELSHDFPGNEGHDHAEDEHAEEEGEHDHDHGDHEGHDHIEGFNEHVWYDPHTVAHLAEEIAAHLSEALPDDADAFAGNLETFVAGIEDLEAQLDGIAEAHGGAAVFVTEPVPLYLIAAAGLENVTPEAFSEAVEEGQDVPPATMLESIDLLAQGKADVVIVNAQTGGAETDQVIRSADEAGIPVLEFTETLPDGQTYLEWMGGNAQALADALV